MLPYFCRFYSKAKACCLIVICCKVKKKIYGTQQSKSETLLYDCFCICVNGMYKSLMNIYTRKSLN